MITEDYVSFEVAKLLKEKGFNEFTYSYYSKDDEESEDERIRKALITLTKVPRKAIFEAQGITKEQALAWLEKQKKQKDFQAKVKQRMEYLWDKLPDANRVNKGNCTPEEWKTLGAYMELEMNFDKDSEEQKEQKPAEFLSKEKVFAIMNKLTSLSFCVPLGSDEEKKIHEITCDVSSLLDYPIEQKPAEWSEEDKFKLEDAITGIDVGIGFYETEGKHPNLLKAIIEAKEWLKSLRPQPKPEWSEEDEEMFDEALAGVLLARNRMNDTGCIGLAERFEKAYKWLESFRPRPHWEPSEEQMKALSETIAFAPDTFKPKCTLVTLHDDLKKL